ncbi:hypothetical protein LP52_21765 [Streptomonospora alba]|uniref:Uncharacterized protein n=1 Tax=Streptomonospora alba TaxID=183763 RepID=A0A0C2G0R5_9ACTN|nr:hypothetical protein LP52_21765 [Streptomonospora alba]
MYSQGAVREVSVFIVEGTDTRVIAAFFGEFLLVFLQAFDVLVFAHLEESVVVCQDDLLLVDHVELIRLVSRYCGHAH